MSNDMMTPELVRLGVTVDGDKNAVIAKMAERHGNRPLLHIYLCTLSIYLYILNLLKINV